MLGKNLNTKTHKAKRSRPPQRLARTPAAAPLLGFVSLSCPGRGFALHSRQHSWGPGGQMHPRCHHAHGTPSASLYVVPLAAMWLGQRAAFSKWHCRVWPEARSLPRGPRPVCGLRSRSFLTSVCLDHFPEVRTEACPINRETSALRAHLPRSPGLGITQQVGLSASLRTFLLGHRAHFRRTGGTCAARSLGRLAEVSLGGPQAQMAPARACR